MAFAVLVSLTQSTARILRDEEPFPLSDAGKQQITKLRAQILILQEVVKRLPQEANDLETRIREAANQAEDIVEHFMYELTRSSFKSKRLAEIGRVVPPDNMVYDLRELRFAMEEMDTIIVETESMRKEEVKEAGPTPSTASIADLIDDFTVGLEKSLEKIINAVTRGSSKLLVTPITGMGGIGKTTLARKVYNDGLVMNDFPIRAWVTVSQEYKIDNIFAKLLDDLQKQAGEVAGRSGDSAEDKIYKILLANKFLIVLDDLWSEKAWNEIKKAFPTDALHGSRVVVTTRISSVANQTNTSGALHEMEFLSTENSWILLNQKVFRERKCSPEFEKLGREISTSCGGLPLAIVLIAGILSNIEETIPGWEDVGKDVHAAVDEKDGRFEKIISLSYTHLPRYMRPCFLYVGGFPEDYEIRISKLLRLWIAEGFVKDEKEAEMYLLNLVSRSLALASTIKSDGNVKSCNVHDMVRDLCKKNSLNENYERRLSIGHPDLTRVARAYASTLRTVLSMQPNESSLGGLRKFRLLRVLDVVDTDAYSLPAPVFELFHLRYLAFGCPMEVPAAISRLQNLRCLIVRPSKRLRRPSTDQIYLPLEIWMMPLLTHLVSFFDLLDDPKEAAVALENLLTLTVVKKLICTEKMMERISNVKKLSITYSGDKYQEDYQLKNLSLLKKLEKLTLIQKGYPHRREINPSFPVKLRKLTLSGWRLPWESMEAACFLPNLQVLKLKDHACEGDKWETKENQFPMLEYLHIDNTDISELDTLSHHFPKLKRLRIFRCHSLQTLPECMVDMTALQMIEIDRANEALTKNAKEIQADAKDGGNLFQVRN